MMNMNYISGFFDADGSITLSVMGKREFRTVKIDFTNTKKSILLEIQEYLKNNYGINTCISTKPAKKENHSVSYTLSAVYNNAYKLCELLDSHHPMKKHRINTVLKYQKLVTRRNGQYTKQQKNRKLAFERLFFWTIFQ